ncbi:MAG: VacJ family lipoprotein [Piscirickettsiaceae bacterium]|nr:VacJ family lipoprotein [Piscirickettsiaceae bacterium]
MIFYIVLVLSGCSTTADLQKEYIPPMHPVEDYVKEDVDYVVNVYDPWEKMNRAVYKFNAKFDRFIFLPILDVYDAILPDFVEDGIANFFSNIGETTNFTNSVLQLKPDAAVSALSRFVFNSTIGLFGVLDVATPMNIPEWEEDFGQTLGHYGVSNGPYLVLPILGPSSLRDATGLAVDAAVFQVVDPLNLDDHRERKIAYGSLKAISTRREIEFRYYESGTPFEYDMTRLLYGKWREIQINK